MKINAPSRGGNAIGERKTTQQMPKSGWEEENSEEGQRALGKRLKSIYTK